MAKNNAINNNAGELTIDPGASGDSWVQFSINGTPEFKIGVDDDDGDSFKISQGSDLGSNDVFMITSAGEITKPLQSAFLATLNTTDSNVTGDATWHVLGSGNALTEVFDQNSDFATSGTFVAPITGRYLLCMTVKRDGLTSSHTVGLCKIVTSNRQYFHGWNNPWACADANDEYSTTFATLADMDAADTAIFQMRVDSGAKVVDVTGNGTDAYTFVSGVLIA